MGVHHDGLHHFAFLLISHDLSMVRFISDRTGVMLQGRLVEVAPTEELFSHPLHPYTRSLLSAVRVPDPLLERSRQILPFDFLSLPGTHLTEASPGHFVLR